MSDGVRDYTADSVPWESFAPSVAPNSAQRARSFVQNVALRILALGNTPPCGNAISLCYYNRAATPAQPQAPPAAAMTNLNSAYL